MSEETKKNRPKKRGTVDIIDERCKGCSFCVTYCPTDALIMSENLNSKGYRLPILEHPDKCNGCNLCGRYCPDFAIKGRRLEREKG